MGLKGRYVLILKRKALVTRRNHRDEKHSIETVKDTTAPDVFLMINWRSEFPKPTFPGYQHLRLTVPDIIQRRNTICCSGPKPTFSGFKKLILTAPDFFQMRNWLLSYRNAPKPTCSDYYNFTLTTPDVLEIRLLSYRNAQSHMRNELLC